MIITSRSTFSVVDIVMPRHTIDERGTVFALCISASHDAQKRKEKEGTNGDTFWRSKRKEEGGVIR